ncbi:UNVERIFIED_CONTAM: hypothetical protein FKN15_075523 [Acipenser sinensis]
MDRNALTELLEALESRRDAEERRREERYTALIERPCILTEEEIEGMDAIEADLLDEELLQEEESDLQEPQPSTSTAG